jgi:hypothetical protein
MPNVGVLRLSNKEVIFLLIISREYCLILLYTNQMKLEPLTVYQAYWGPVKSSLFKRR